MKKEEAKVAILYIIVKLLKSWSLVGLLRGQLVVEPRIIAMV
jgi:hypothetical protein